MIEYPKYKKVLFCTDFSENSDCAFDYAFGVAKRDNSMLYILHVIPGNPYKDYLNLYLSKKDWDRVKTNMREDLDKKFSDQYLSHIKDQSKVKIVVKAGLEDEEILRFAKKEKIDLITIGTHGRTGIEHALFGSVAEKVIRSSRIPVFIIPCKQKSGRASSK